MPILPCTQKKNYRETNKPQKCEVAISSATPCSLTPGSTSNKMQWIKYQHASVHSSHFLQWLHCLQDFLPHPLASNQCLPIENMSPLRTRWIKIQIQFMTSQTSHYFLPRDYERVNILEALWTRANKDTILHYLNVWLMRIFIPCLGEDQVLDIKHVEYKSKTL